MNEKNIEDKWWTRHPVWNLQLGANQFAEVLTVIRHLPSLPVEGVYPPWQWGITNPDYTHWTGTKFIHYAHRMIVNVCNGVIQCASENLPKIQSLAGNESLSSEWKIQCIGAGEWIKALFQQEMTDEKKIESFLWTARHSWNYDRTAEVVRQLNYRWLEFAASKRLPPESITIKRESSSLMFPADEYRLKNGLRPNTLNKARRNGRLHAERRGGRWFYPLDEVSALWPDVFAEEDKNGTKRDGRG